MLMIDRAPAAVPVRHTAAASAPSAEPIPIFVPARILIPALAVSAPIVPVGTEADGSMGTPKDGYDVAWWQGVRVGAGNALFAGHHDWNGDAGSFYSLGDLKPGDQIIVEGDGAAVRFRVSWVKLLHGGIDATDILGPATGPHLADKQV